MSDESDYYSNTDSDSDEEQSVNKVLINKKQVPNIINSAKKFGNYIEDESEIDDSEPDDADEDEDENDDDQIGGADEIQDDEANAKKIDDNDDDDAIEENDDDENDDEDIQINEDGEVIEKSSKQLKQTKIKKQTQLIIDDNDDDDDDDGEYDETYLQKFDSELNKNYIYDFHPECLNHNYDEVLKLSLVVRDENNIIIDPLHKSIPFLTKYEKARVLGQRAKQIENGCKPFIKVPEYIIDSYVIAELELREKKIPFIIKRPIPGGAFEYWNIKDLENINF